MVIPTVKKPQVMQTIPEAGQARPTAVERPPMEDRIRPIAERHPPTEDRIPPIAEIRPPMAGQIHPITAVLPPMTDPVCMKQGMVLHLRREQLAEPRQQAVTALHTEAFVRQGAQADLQDGQEKAHHPAQGQQEQVPEPAKRAEEETPAPARVQVLENQQTHLAANARSSP